MAIDPRISLAAQVPSVTPAINIFENALNNAQTRDIRQQQMEQDAVMNPLRAQQAQQGVDINSQNIAAGEAQAQQANQLRILKSVNDFGVQNQSVIDNALATGDAAPLQASLTQRLATLKQQGLPTQETEDALFMVGQGNIQGVADSIRGAQDVYNQRQNQGMSAAQREFNQLSTLATGNPESDITKAARIKLGLDPRAAESAAERIVKNPTVAKQIAKQAGDVAGEQEAGKSKAKLKFAPQITKAVKLAEKAAIERGDVLNDLDRMTAALPGVRDAVSQLKELAPLTTTTWGGAVWDAAVKQTGFGATKGSTALAKFQAIVDNQVLPLLKPTFGGSFSVQEGESLKATLGDPSASPAEKLATLDAFMNQKERDIQSKQAQIDQGGNTQRTGGVIMTDANGNRATVYPDGTFEEL
jgi:hypothetical protein